MYSKLPIYLVAFLLLCNCNPDPNISELAERQKLDSVLVHLKSAYRTFDNIEIISDGEYQNALLIEESYRITCCGGVPCIQSTISDIEAEVMAQDMMLSMGIEPYIKDFDAVIFHFTMEAVISKSLVVKIPIKKSL